MRPHAFAGHPARQARRGGRPFGTGDVRSLTFVRVPMQNKARSRAARGGTPGGGEGVLGRAKKRMAQGCTDYLQRVCRLSEQTTQNKALSVLQPRSAVINITAAPRRPREAGLAIDAMRFSAVRCGRSKGDIGACSSQTPIVAVHENSSIPFKVHIFRIQKMRGRE